MKSQLTPPKKVGSSGVSFNQHVVKEVVETVLNKSNILQQSLIEAKSQSTSNFTEAADCPSKSNAAESCLLLQQLENDTELLNIISNKLSKAIKKKMKYSGN